MDTPTSAPGTDDTREILSLFGRICDRTGEVVAETTDWGMSGRRTTQYAVDVAVDEACLPPLLDAGFAVLSEESGVTLPDGVTSPDDAPGTVVVDPLDGSTNAALGLPWCATALCLVVDGRPVVATVANLRTGDRFEAVRGGGAWRNGEQIRVATPVGLGDAVVGLNGVPPRHLGWRQYRALGATALDICSVASGGLDGYVDLDPGNISVWDYLAAVLVLTEAGGVAADLGERDLVTLDPDDVRRDPIAASHPGLLAGLRAAVHGA